MTQASIDKLKEQIKPLIRYCEQRRDLNQRLGIGIGLAGILLGLGATIVGTLFQEDARIAAILGTGSATTQAILQFIGETPAAVPTPALLPGLVGLGMAALRKRKQNQGQEAAETVEV